MKILGFSLLLLSSLSKPGCLGKRAMASGCYKGRLEIKAMCMNDTIKVMESNIDTGLIERQWRNDGTGKTYSNVFGLSSRCTFPASIKEGNEFYFTIDSTTVQNCAVCLTYYPTSEKKLSIKILPGGCP